MDNLSELPPFVFMILRGANTWRRGSAEYLLVRIFAARVLVPHSVPPSRTRLGRES